MINKRTGVLALAVVVSMSVACGGGGSSKKDTAARSVTSASGKTTTSTAHQSSSSTASTDSTQVSTTRPPSSSGDLCNLVTQDEAAKLIGKPVRRSQGSKTNGPLGVIGGCAYLEAGPAGTTPGVHSIVNVALLGTKVSRDQFLGQIGADAPGSVDVPGVGEVAKLIQGGILAVFDHGRALTVEIIVDGKPAPKDALVKVAKTALHRL